MAKFAEEVGLRLPSGLSVHGGFLDAWRSLRVEVLAELEKVKTKKEGIFVMPVERITITEAYVVGSERAPRHATEL